MIAIKNLVKRYGELVAVDNISFNVEPGQVLGFLGPNGAGKSTTMKMIAGFLSPTSGSISVCGLDAENEPLKTKQMIGYLPEGAPAYGEMTPQSFLSFIAGIRGLDSATRNRRLGDVIERLGLQKVLQQPIDTLSKGFRRRVGIAQALLHDPKVLILDEPTDGLDPNQKQEVRDLIAHMASDKIVIISTHILEEVNAVCNRAIIISSGKLLADETPAALEARSRYFGAVTMTTPQADTLRGLLQDLPDVEEVELDPHQQTLTAVPRKGKAIFAAVQELIRSRSLPVSALSLERGRLDEVFRTITAAGANP
jgi:ABC-2 type transport system ATP-binding protein